MNESLAKVLEDIEKTKAELTDVPEDQALLQTRIDELAGQLKTALAQARSAQAMVDKPEEVSVNEIASSVGLAKATVERFLDLLEKVFILTKVNLSCKLL